MESTQECARGRASLLTLLALIAISSWLCGCAGSAPLSSPAANPSNVTPQYRMAPGDQVRITIFNQPNLSGDFTLDGAGFIPLPLVGLIEGANKTPNELAQFIADELSRQGFLVNPNVAVQVIQFRPYYILGEVAAPGVYPYTINLTVIQAVAAAKGFTYRANTRRVFIQRAGDNAERLYDLTPATLLLPGDTVRIPERLF